MRATYLAALSVAVLTLLAGCNGSSSSSSNNRQGGQPTAAATDIYALARGCYHLQSTSGGYVSSTDSSYTTTAAAANAEAFYMQATGLGRYLLYGRDEHMPAAVDGAVARVAAPSDEAIWKLSYQPASNTFFLRTSDNEQLSVNNSGELVIASSGNGFRLVPAQIRCTAFPEMPIGISGDDSYKGRGVDQPIVGFAEVHTHMGMSSELSADDSVGPSAGGVLYGQVFHRLGVAHALHDCEEFHGPNGIRDANNILEQNPTGNHDTQGWPTFVDWPARNFLTHQVMYYRWVERAWRAGLRVMVNHGTNIKALCELGRSYALQPDADCDDMSIALKQIDYLYQVQDYIDAQHGGPGKGWYRIVKSPLEARQVINDGKLAVILGVEVAEVFDCGVRFQPDGSEQRLCDTAQIDQQIDMLWERGVRHVYPYHDIDSSLGGAGIFSGDVLNFLNFMQTNRFWKTTECRDYPEDEPMVRKPGSEMTTAFPYQGDDPLSTAFFEHTGGIVPLYPAGQRCNARTVTDLGEHALRALMKKRMIIDIDHAAYHSKDRMLAIAAEQSPAYPMVSSHNAHGGLTSDQAIQLLKDGGTIYPYKGNGSDHASFLEKLKYWRAKAGLPNDAQHLALGYGADGNGFGGHAGPRGGDAKPVRYPFELFQGEDWGPQFNHIAPVSVAMLTILDSGKFWHIDEVGMAHYGMVADFVEEVRLESGEEGLSALYNSAEEFIQMWERVWNRN